jgi:hypothetical protein
MHPLSNQSLSMLMISSSSTPQSGVGLRCLGFAFGCREAVVPPGTPRSRPRKLGGIWADRKAPSVFPAPQDALLGCDSADGFSFDLPFASETDAPGLPVSVLPEPEKEG